MVRGFARYLQAFDPAAQVPPAGLLPARTRRVTPYIYSDAEVAALMTAARMLRNPLKAATFETLIGLLAVTGMRGSEAMPLDRGDLDTDRRAADRPRHQVPQITPAAAAGEPRCGRSPATRPCATGCARRPRRRACWSPRPGRGCARPPCSRPSAACSARPGSARRPPRPRPVIHGLRHTFAVKTLLGWYRDGQDVQARMPALSTYLGHVAPAATYWYLTGTPELLALAAGRLEAATGGAP